MNASAPPTSGEMIQLNAIAPIFDQTTAWSPAATIAKPITAPMIAWVVETGWPKYVATLSHIDEAISAASMPRMSFV